MTERSCNTCTHHVQEQRLADVPERCWTCVTNSRELPGWEPIQVVRTSRPLVALTGPAGCGKDTAASVLIECYGFIRLGFADALKRGLCAMFDWTPAQIEDRAFKERVLPEFGFSPRKAMQTLGTEWGRGLKGDLWLMLAGKEIERLERAGAPGVVIADLRFDNEAKWVSERGGKVWWIERPSIKQVEAHSSESGVSGELCDLFLPNRYGIESFRTLVRSAAFTAFPALPFKPLSSR